MSDLLALTSVTFLSMGRSTWRLQELLLLERLRNSDCGRDLLSSSGTKWWTNARNWFVAEYQKEFSHVQFDAETDEEFDQRKKLQPRGDLERYPAESEDDRKARVSRAPEVSTATRCRRTRG